jgi:hypothetical protein
VPEGADASRRGLAWRDAFIDWLGALNRANASLAWWAYTSTAKNFLSSPLGDACLGALGANAAQGATRPPALEPLARLVWQFGRMLGLWCSGALRAPAGEPPHVLIFTYVDGSFRGGPDAFFGTLAQQLPVRARHVAYVQAAYRAALPKLAASDYAPLFGMLRLGDLLWTLGASLRAWWRAGRYDGQTLGSVQGTSLLRHALRWDIGRGGYFYNLLVHRAALRLLAKWQPQWLLYPYENKSLEKMLLLATRAASPRTRIVGYQHTSITRRHATLIFAAGEAAATPLPDRIVTAGNVTRRYLETHGRYPAGMFVTGCALRQQRAAALERRARDGTARLLLALSSSRRELVDAVVLCRRALEAGGGLELAIRTHPEFPVALLPAELRDWAHQYARDLSGTPLAENLEWCDAVAYVSSTVALEALGRGRPVIHLALSDVIDPDPVLDPVEFHWIAEGPAALHAATRAILSLDAAEFERRRRDALSYIDEYLKTPTAEALRAFLPA